MSKSGDIGKKGERFADNAWGKRERGVVGKNEERGGGRGDSGEKLCSYYL